VFRLVLPTAMNNGGVTVLVEATFVRGMINGPATIRWLDANNEVVSAQTANFNMGCAIGAGDGCTPGSARLPLYMWTSGMVITACDARQRGLCEYLNGVMDDQVGNAYDLAQCS